ncbi:cation diffusion facilitator family transporter [Laspinema sp. A4]|uniref:cation diffusion facilitator family transporter n=1 Tax=Laspinema sp. D2d TaxID=2953686 RepID=UPI0021BB6E86|nr:cation diffusion facilitator family transporter [Laspinema sp. D2d]MCT7982345.1 cation diffusion facilitator family transporter [Laspinema sp. D2d]
MATDNRVEVRRVLLITLGLNLVVLGIKAVVGTLTGSLSLLADALHSVTDSANNILGLVTNHFASPHPDREHPYGHQKFDAVGALGIAAFLGVACFEILSSAIARIFFGEGTRVEVSPQDLWILLIVLGINIFVAFYERTVGRRIGSSILIADAKHTMSDVWVTIIVMAGLIAITFADRWPWLQWVDVMLAFPVALLVFRSGWEVLTDNLPWLVDKMAIAPEAIHAITMQVPGVLNCHNIASRGVVGRQVFIEMHLIVDANDVETAHAITEEVEARLQGRFSPARILIHIEPPRYQSSEISYEPESPQPLE